MDQPKFTIIVPTRERADVLGPALRTLTAQNYERLEIIVSDNFSTDGTRDVVESARDPRIRYLNTGKRISMSHNWEFALSHVSDGWVSFLGDDDGLMPDALAKLDELIRETKALAIRTEHCRYFWPGVGRPGKSRLIVPIGSGFEMRRSRPWIDRVLRGAAGYGDLPVIYPSGFVSMSVIERIRQRKGRFFLSSIPDVYSGFAIAGAVEQYVYAHEPLAIAGLSRHSNGRATFRKDAESRAVHLRFLSEGNIPFHPDVALDPGGILPQIDIAYRL